MIKQFKQPESKVGRKEKLTEDLAKRIAIIVRNFPDTEIEVTWKNVIDQVKRRFGLKFHRNTLSQKEWGGQKLIAIAFDEAEGVQKRLLKQKAPKYADNPRSRLRIIIAKLQAENLVLREQIAKIRAQQFDELHSLLDLRTPLHRLREPRSEQSTKSDNDLRHNREIALSLVGKNSTSVRVKVVKQSNTTFRRLPLGSTDNEIDK